MKVVMPKAIELIYSSLPAENIPMWSNSVTYAMAAEVQLEENIFVSLKDNNLNHKPGTGNAVIPDFWVKLRPTNRMAMFDAIIATQSIAPEAVDTITVTVTISSCNAFALLNIDATELFISASEHVDGSNPYYTESIDLIRDCQDWWGYYFEAATLKRDFVKTDLPITPRGYLTIKLKSYGRRPALGHFVVGQLVQLGVTEFGISASFRSYSRKKTDDFGNTFLNKGRTAKRFSGLLYVQPRHADTVYDKLVELDGVPALWIGDNVDASAGGFQSLTVYGWLESFNQQFDGPNQVGLSIEIQGLI